MYTTIEPCTGPDGDIEACRYTAVIAADGSDPTPISSVTNDDGAAFIPGTSTVVLDGVQYLPAGADTGQDWFDRGFLETNAIAVSADGETLAHGRLRLQRRRLRPELPAADRVPRAVRRRRPQRPPCTTA